MWKNIGFVTLGLLVFSGFYAGLSLICASSEEAAVKIGDILPAIEADSLEGIPITFRPPEGKYLLVFVWSSNDPQIEETVKAALQLYKRFHEKGLNAVGIYTDILEASVFRFSEQWLIPWPQVMDSTGEEKKITEQLKIAKIPSNLLVDSQGKILAVNLTGDSAHETTAKILEVSLTDVPMPEVQTPRKTIVREPNGIAISPMTTESLPQYMKFLGTPEERKQAEPCKKNLRKISFAITAYQKDHNGELPNWLSDLYPKYIDDKSVFICPTNPNPIPYEFLADPKIKTNYLFEFAPAEDGARRQYRQWKTDQLQEFGDKVPLVRCLSHPRSLNLTYGGEINFYNSVWKNEVPAGHTLDDRDAKSRKALREIACALVKYKNEKGELPNELIELYPNYIEDPSRIKNLSPNESFPVYKFTPQNNYRQQNTDKLSQFGDYVPVVQIPEVLPEGRIINLSYGGEIWESGGVWESDLVRQGEVQFVKSSSRRIETIESPLDYQINGPLTARGYSVSEILRMVQSFSHFPIVRENRPDAKVTVALENPTIRDILNVVLPPLNETYFALPDGMIRIDTPENIEKMENEPGFVTRLLDKVRKDLSNLASALEAFFIDNNAYPLPRDGKFTIDAAGIKIGSGADARYFNLTTPVCYISKIPKDPFNRENKSYQYTFNGTGYILSSFGPNRKADFDISKVDLKQIKITEYSYDPSNGLISAGDLFKIQ